MTWFKVLLIVQGSFLIGVTMAILIFSYLFVWQREMRYHILAVGVSAIIKSTILLSWLYQPGNTLLQFPFHGYAALLAFVLDDYGLLVMLRRQAQRLV